MASACHRHVPGCSLELSVGRQTKIELISSPPAAAAAAAAPAVAAVAAAGLPASNPRFTPRHCTPLSALAPQGAGFDREGIGGGSGGASAKVGNSGGGGEGRGRLGLEAGAEVDLVGCLVGVTVERPPSPPACSPREEVFATADSILHDHAVTRGGGGPGDDGVQAPALASLSAVPGDEYVMYRVYLTDASGACVVLSKRVRPELARHHRILRGSPGTCWAVVNAGKVGGGGGGVSASFLSTSSRGALLRSGGAAAGAAAVSWSSATAVGGNGSGPPPRSIGGAPAGHLARPLSGLRRWAEGGEGRSAVRRERQRLALLLARERRLGAALSAGSPALACPPPAEAGEGTPSAPLRGASGGGCSAEEGGASAVPVLPAAAAAAAAAVAAGASQGQEATAAQQRTLGPPDDAVAGFVSSFEFVRRGVEREEPPAERGDEEPLLRVNVDTGERWLAAGLSRGALGELLGLALDDCERQPLGQGREGEGSAAAAAAAAGDDDIGGDDVARTSEPRSDGTAPQELLALTIAALGSGVTPVCQNEWASLGGESSVEALASALCRLACRERQPRCGSSGSCGGGGGGGSSPSAAVGHKTATFAETGSSMTENADRVNVAVAASGQTLPLPADSTACSGLGRESGDGVEVDQGVTEGTAQSAAAQPPSGGGGEGASGGVSEEVVLENLASACGRKQLAFSVSRPCPRLTGREVGALVTGVWPVDAARSAENLLKDLEDASLPPPSR